jgi:hypothetical protein
MVQPFLPILPSSRLRLIGKIASGDSKRDGEVNSPDDDNGEAVTEVCFKIQIQRLAQGIILRDCKKERTCICYMRVNIFLLEPSF